MLIAFLIAALTGAQAAESSSTPSCRASWNVVGACFAVHGRVSLVNPAPASPRSPRALIRSADGARVFGVLGLSYGADGPGVLPKELEARLRQAQPGTGIEGDFTLCPLDRDTQRESIRLVCVQEVANFSARR